MNMITAEFTALNDEIRYTVRTFEDSTESRAKLLNQLDSAESFIDKLIQIEQDRYDKADKRFEQCSMFSSAYDRALKTLLDSKSKLMEYGGIKHLYNEYRTTLNSVTGLGVTKVYNTYYLVSLDPSLQD